MPWWMFAFIGLLHVYSTLKKITFHFKTSLNVATKHMSIFIPLDLVELANPKLTNLNLKFYTILSRILPLRLGGDYLYIL
jgi:hypothetical protein